MINYINTLLFLLIFTLLSGCSSDDDSTEEEVITTEPPVVIIPKIASSDWPVIHQNNQSTKDNLTVGPEVLDQSKIDEWLTSNTVLLLLGENYLYQQPGQDTSIYAYDPNNLSAGPVFQVNLGVSFPDVGGGIIDDNGNLWFNLQDRIVRLSEDLSSPTYSENMEDTFPGTVFPKNNGMTLFSDGNILSTSTGKDAWLVSTAINENNEFPVLAYFDFTQLQLNDEFILADETQFNPRPVLNDNDEFIIMSESYMVKLRYDTELKTIDNNIIWVFKNPENSNSIQSTIGISHAVIMADKTCAATGPITDAVTMKVYCVDSGSGVLLNEFEPFPNAPGARALHNLGGFRDTNSLVAIVNDTTGNGNAGVAVFDLTQNSQVGESVLFNFISESFVLAAGNQRIYLAKRDSLEEPFQILSIVVSTGEYTTIYESDASGPPRAGLGAVGEFGLYFPTPEGLVHIRN
jgi:hypothetical protein